MAQVSFNNVEIRYLGADRPTVPNLNLDIADGEFLVLVGPSGCGKSTTLRSLAGLETVTGGSITIGGKDVTNAEPGERDIAMVFQDYALYPHMTVAENMGFALKVAKTPKDEIQARVAQAAATLGLEEFLDRKPKDLSGGQRQRVAMGRAIVREPQVFLMDEPLSNLDAKLRVQTRAQIVKLQKNLGVTTVYVTHDQVEAMTMGDRVAVLKLGELQQVDTPKKLYEEPANAFVAGFIGSPAMNLFTLDAASAKAGIPGWNLDIPESGVTNGVIVGIRPEALQVTDAAAATQGAGISGKVAMVEELGADSYIYVETAHGQLVARGGDTRVAPHIGDSVALHPRAGALVHYFAVDTEERITSHTLS